jgi:hypothetical protein
MGPPGRYAESDRTTAGIGIPEGRTAAPAGASWRLSPTSSPASTLRPMDQDLPAGVHSFRPVDDPLAHWPKDRPLPIRLIEPGFAPASAVPERVVNWDYYDGAIVMVGVTDGETYVIEGSGVTVAPGLVLGATHVLRHHADAIAAKALSVYCIGVRSGGRADLWAVPRSLRYAEDHSDIMFLGVELNSEISDDWYVSCLPISTRVPEEGEPLTIVGYRFDREEAKPLPIINGVRAVGRGDLYIAAGEVEKIYYPHRDRLLAPFPAIEIKCGSLGSMSGGAVIDQAGALVGILSRVGVMTVPQAPPRGSFTPSCST